MGKRGVEELVGWLKVKVAWALLTGVVAEGVLYQTRDHQLVWRKRPVRKRGVKGVVEGAGA